MVRLDSPAGDQRIGSLGERLGDHVGKLPHLVPAERERYRVIALDEQRRPAAQRVAQPIHLFDGRGQLAERY
jgi:hypothetical protein